MPLDAPWAASAFVAFGVLVGAYGTLVGAGGGFLVVPALILACGFDPKLAVGTSLAVVLCNAMSGTWAYARRGLVEWRTALVFAAATVPGSLLGPHLLAMVPERAFKAAFGLLLLGLAAWLLFKPAPPADAGGARRGLFWGAVLSLGVGFLSSMLGIGGGVIHVPVLIYLLGFPAHVAIATSHATLAVSAGFGVAAHAREGQVLWGTALPIGLGALVGAQAGAWLSRRVAMPWVIRALGAAIALVGVRCLWMAFSG